MIGFRKLGTGGEVFITNCLNTKLDIECNVDYYVHLL